MTLDSPFTTTNADNLDSGAVDRPVCPASLLLRKLFLERYANPSDVLAEPLCRYNGSNHVVASLAPFGFRHGGTTSVITLGRLGAGPAG